jgi:catechol 2,3-dioxygenase-like lactoylglutathione lyase family enzyme
MHLNQLTIPVFNIEKSIAFYKTLGLHLIVHSSTEYARFECTEGGSTFSLHRLDELPTGNGIWIYFEEQCLDERVHQLQQKAIVFEELPKDQPWLWREARLKDPDNNQLILYAAGENRLNPPWRI